MKIEFYGGPLDGEHLEIPEGANEYLVPIPKMFEPSDFVRPTGSIPEALQMRVHRYRIARYTKGEDGPTYHAMKYVGESVA